MKTKGLLMAMVALMMCCVSNEAFAYDIKVENADGVMIYYNYINDGQELEVTSAPNNYSGSVVIPENVSFMNRTRKVTSIGNYTFKSCFALTSITIPNSVTSIGDYAFSGCTGLTSVNIGSSVTSIGDGAFRNCASLTSITIPNSVTSIGYEAFYYCTSLTSITIPNSVTSFGNEAFYNCTGLTSITIPESVTSIGRSAFSNCTGLTSINIPNSVTSIGYRAFVGCTGLTSITIGNSVASIGQGAFSNCTGLTSITIGNSVTSIESHTFRDCSSLTSITIPNSVTSIGNEAFYKCSGLTSITIPESVTSIGTLAFDGCDISTVISLIEEPFAIYGKSGDDRTFSANTYNNATLYVPAGTIDKYNATNGWKDFLFIEEVDGGGGGDDPEGGEGLDDINIFSNGSFEQWSDGIPLQWMSTNTASTKDVLSQSADAHTGHYSVQIAGSTSHNNRLASTELSLEAGYYIIEFYVKPLANGGSVRPGYVPLKDDGSVGSYVYGDYVNDIPAGQWTKVTYTFSLDATTNVNLVVMNPKKPGQDILIDDYSITNANGGGGNTGESCAKPTIHYQNGKLTFKCATEGAQCHSTITDSDIASYDVNDVDLSVTYHIRVYATKNGYTNSETATATLCWIDVEPQKEGITDEDEDAVEQVKAMPVLIQAEGRMMTISGASPGTPINVYDLNGRQLSTTTAAEGVTRVNVGTNEKMVLVKVGEKTIKIAL